MRYQVLTENEGLDLYREFLDETCEPVEVAGHTFNPSRVLEEMDPIAFHEGFQSYTEVLADSGTLVEDYTDGYQEDEDEDLGETDIRFETDYDYALASDVIVLDENEDY